MNEPGLEFVWVGDDAVDPLQQAQTLKILVGAGIKTREEARAELGLGAGGGRAWRRGRRDWGSSIRITTRRGGSRRRRGSRRDVRGQNLERELLVGGMKSSEQSGDPLDRSCFRLYSTNKSLEDAVAGKHGTYSR